MTTMLPFVILSERNIPRDSGASKTMRKAVWVLGVLAAAVSAACGGTGEAVSTDVTCSFPKYETRATRVHNRNEVDKTVTDDLFYCTQPSGGRVKVIMRSIDFGQAGVGQTLDLSGGTK